LSAFSTGNEERDLPQDQSDELAGGKREQSTVVIVPTSICASE